jgi:hypothetical protein
MIWPTTPTGSLIVAVELGARQGQRRRHGRCSFVAQPAIPEQVGGERDVGGRGDGLRLAVVERIELGQLVEVLGDQITQTVDRAAALDGVISTTGRRARRPPRRRG